MRTIVLYGCPEDNERFKEYLKNYTVQCFAEQEELIPALMKECPAAVWVTKKNAAGMEGVIAARRIHPKLPVAWFSNDSGFAPQAYRLHVDYFSLMPVDQTRISTALRKCGIETGP